MKTKDDTIEVTFRQLGTTDPDVLVALLAENGFDGFDESENLLKAYTSREAFDEGFVQELADRFFVVYEVKNIEAQNWNAVWESHFEPVMIDDFVAIRADFHEPILQVQHEIIITPKMSFGTGHHATTTMMIQQMQNLVFSNKKVFDFGTGTGILSILAEKLGAESIIAIDNDMWSIENSRENINRNSCNQIQIELRNNADVEGTFDIILANINRNVILENLSSLYSQLKKGGFLLLSGLLADDEKEILAETKLYELEHMNTRHRLQWISLLFGR